MNSVAQAFSIHVPEEELADLRARLQNSRWLTPIQHKSWTYGTDYDYLQQLVAYWIAEFDWRKQERRINQLAQYRMRLRGLGIHYVHLRSDRAGAIPLVLCHGWPGGFTEFQKLAAALMQPKPSEPHFDLIIPSMPGFGFSDPPAAPGVGIHYIADLWAELMLALGYQKFAVHGGDWGSWVAIALSRKYPERVIGAHLNYVSGRYLPELTRAASPEESEFLKRATLWSSEEAAYIQIQQTKPQTLGFALEDSPVGLAAWIIEKFRGWSSAPDNVESVFSKAELLTIISLYWFTRSMYSAMCLYKEARADIADADWNHTSATPIAIARFPDEIPFPPRSHLAKYLNIKRWSTMHRGGHFAALESPDELAADIATFFGDK